MKKFTKTTATLALAAGLLISLTGCGGESLLEREERLYNKCVDAGGTFISGDDYDFTCILPTKEL